MSKEEMIKILKGALEGLERAESLDGVYSWNEDIKNVELLIEFLEK